MKGAFSIAAISANEKGKIYAAKQKSPLLIGKGIEENFVASDPLAIAHITEKFYLLEDGDFAEISENEIMIFNNKSPKVSRINS